MKNGLYLLLFFVLAAGLSLRLSRLASHHTHFDDIGIALMTLEPNFYPRNLPQAINDPQHFIYKKPLAKKIRESKGLTQQAYTALFHVELVAKRYILSARWLVECWTYAPASLWIQAGLIWPNQSYETVKTLGRLPSALYSCLGLVLCLWACLLMAPQRPELALLVLTLQAFSWEGIILANHMAASYAAGQALMWALVVLWLKWERNPSSPTYTALLGGGLAVAPLFSYQLLFLVPLLAAIFWLKAGTGKPAFHSARRYGVLAGLTLVSWALAAKIIGGKSEHLSKPTWAWGEQYEYTWRGWRALELPIQEKILLWFQQLYDSIWVQNAPGLEDNGLQAGVLAVLWILILLSGLASFSYWRKHQTSLGLWLLSCLGIWFMLYFAGRISISPSRHTYIYMVPIFLLALPGMARLPQKVTVPVSLLFSGVLIALFFSDYSAQNLQRFDYWNQAQVDEVIKQEKPSTVVEYGYTGNLTAMPQLWQNEPSRSLVTKIWADMGDMKYDGKTWLLATGSTHPESLYPWQRFWKKEFPQATGVEFQFDTLYRYQSPVEHEYSNLTVNYKPSIYLIRMRAK